MKKLAWLPLFIVSIVILPGVVHAEPKIEVVPKSDITIQPLNPLRGDASPKAGALWGDIKKDVPTGTLIQFVDGFSSPPHIHNITYRAVVIDGHVHNDDPNAVTMWMGPGSFWTQPAGENHITAAKLGNQATAFLEIMEGPYLVRPAKEEFDNGERPINIEARNIIWLNASDVAWLNQSGTLTASDGPQIAFLWGVVEAGQRNGTFLKLPKGYKAKVQGGEAWLRGVLIKGQLSHQSSSDQSNTAVLDPGSYFGATEGAAHHITCTDEAGCTLYVSTKGTYQLEKLL